MPEREAHPLNAPGDFYVENGCCTLCGIPWSAAPELFSVVTNEHCYVARQPNTTTELDRMLTVIECADLECIRYRGRDAAIQTRLVDLGEGRQCDNLSPSLLALSEEVRASRPSIRRAEARRESWWQRLTRVLGL
jgi:hypothetical protein